MGRLSLQSDFGICASNRTYPMQAVASLGGLRGGGKYGIIYIKIVKSRDINGRHMRIFVSAATTCGRNVHSLTIGLEDEES